MVEKVYVNQPADVERFKCFTEQLNEFTESMATERSTLEKELKQSEAAQAEADTAFEDRIGECKEKFTVQQKQLDGVLQELSTSTKKLREEREKWAELQREAHDELMAALDGEDVVDLEQKFGEQFGELIDAMDNMSHKSMSEKLTSLTNLLDSLNIEKKQLEVSIADESSTISGMSAALSPTCGVSYKERNSLRIMIRNQVTGVRTEYQKSRLLEESLKAKLGN